MILARLRQILKMNIPKKSATVLPYIRSNNTQSEKSNRVASLSDQEQKVYKWLFEGYSEAWITETMGLNRSGSKKIFKSIYKKLGVDNRRGIIQYYARREVEFL